MWESETPGSSSCLSFVSWKATQLNAQAQRFDMRGRTDGHRRWEFRKDPDSPASPLLIPVPKQRYT